MDIHPKVEMLLIKRFTKNKPFVKTSKINEMLNSHKRKILKRRSAFLDLQLDKALFESQAYTINKILDEL